MNDVLQVALAKLHFTEAAQLLFEEEVRLPVCLAKEGSYRQPYFAYVLKQRVLVPVEAKCEATLCHPSGCGKYNVVDAMECESNSPGATMPI